MEPVEEVVIDVDEEYSGPVVEKLSARKGELIEMRSAGAGKQRLVFHIPTRSLIGYHGEFMTDTRMETGDQSAVPRICADLKGDIDRRRVGTIVSRQNGKAVAYAKCGTLKNGDLVHRRRRSGLLRNGDQERR